MAELIQIPRYYSPWPHQVNSWRERRKYSYWVKLHSRQTGKTADDIAFSMYNAYKNPGTQTVHIGLDNQWIKNNVYKKYIDGRAFIEDYPKGTYYKHDTEKEVMFLNGNETVANARLKYIGFLNDSAIIGSSYDFFFIEEAGYYPGRDCFQFIYPIWESKLAREMPLHVGINGTPKGTRSSYFDLLSYITGETDPEAFPGEHGNVYIDKKTIYDVKVKNKDGELVRLFDDAAIEKLKDRCMKKFGNLNYFNQEYLVEWNAVNAGLVFQGIEVLQKDGRYCKYNLNTTKPVFISFDRGGRKETSDPHAAVVFQYYNGTMFIYDYVEARAMPFLQFVRTCLSTGYAQYVQTLILPWDTDTTSAMKTEAEEVREAFPNKIVEVLQRDNAGRGLDFGHEVMQNLVINSDKCEQLLLCFLSYEYRRLESKDDWAFKPYHNWASHGCAAYMYGATAVKQMTEFGWVSQDTYKHGVKTYAKGVKMPVDDGLIHPPGYYDRPLSEPRRYSHGRHS